MPSTKGNNEEELTQQCSSVYQLYTYSNYNYDHIVSYEMNDLITSLLAIHCMYTANSLLLKSMLHMHMY